MAVPMSNPQESLEFLEKLRGAAPPNTASRLSQVIKLLGMLAQENEYLNSLVAEDMQQATADTADTDEEADSPPRPPNDIPSEQLVTDDEALALLIGVNEGLRAPLVAIRGRAELIEAGLLGQITQEQQLWLQAIHENTDRAFMLLNALQQLIALRAGQIALNWQTFVSADLLQEAYERMIDRAQSRRHALSIELPETVPLAQGDFYQSLVILSDLLDNALRYTPPGGQIRLTVDSMGTHVLFSVVDNGIGLLPEELRYIGQPFWRGSHRLVRQHPGNGLRLFLARQMLALQGGELIYTGEPGLGSTFSFTLSAPE